MYLSNFQVKKETTVQLWIKPAIYVQLTSLSKQFPDLIKQSAIALENGRNIRALERTDEKRKYYRQVKESPEKTVLNTSNSNESDSSKLTQSPSDNDLSLILQNEAIQIIENNSHYIDASILTLDSPTNDEFNTEPLFFDDPGTGLYFPNACYYPVPILWMHKFDEHANNSQENKLNPCAPSYDQRISSVQIMRKPLRNITEKVLGSLNQKEPDTYWVKPTQAINEQGVEKKTNRNGKKKRNKGRRTIKKGRNNSGERDRAHNTGIKKVYQQPSYRSLYGNRRFEDFYKRKAYHTRYQNSSIELT